MKEIHPLVKTARDLRDLLYRMAREWEATVEEVEDPDESEALTIALADGYPLGKDIDEMVAAMDDWTEHVERVITARPTVLQLVADELTEDVNRVTADLAERGDTNADTAYQGWQNGGLGGEVGRVGGNFTPSVASDLADLLRAVDGGDPESIQQTADRVARGYRAARKTSRS